MKDEPVLIEVLQGVSCVVCGQQIRLEEVREHKEKTGHNRFRGIFNTVDIRKKDEIEHEQ